MKPKAAGIHKKQRKAPCKRNFDILITYEQSVVHKNSPVMHDFFGGNFLIQLNNTYKLAYPYFVEQCPGHTWLQNSQSDQVLTL